MKTDKEARKKALLQILRDVEETKQTDRAEPDKQQEKRAEKVQPDIVTEQDLISQCQSKNKQTAEAAFGQLIQRYQDNVYTYLSYNVENDTSALKMTHDVFIQAYENIPKFHGELSVNTWLLKITEEQLRAVASKWDTRPQQSDNTDHDSPNGPPSGGSGCQDIHSLLSAYAADELNESEIPRVERHLDICTQCWLKYEELKDALDDPAYALAPVPAPEDLAHQILQTLFPKPSLWEQYHSLLIQCYSFLKQFLKQFLKDLLSTWPQIVTVAAAASIAVILIGMPYYSAQRERIYQLEHDVLAASEYRVADDPGLELPIKTVVIFTGKLASQDLPEEALDYAAGILPELNKLDETKTRIINGNFTDIGDSLVENIRSAQGTIPHDHVEPRADHLVIRKIRAIIPQHSNALISLILRQSTPQSSETGELPDTKMTSVTFYLIDKR